MIVDDNMIAEGSFNWLSASREALSPHHNHEVSLVLEGSKAKDLIQDFYVSRVGQEVLKVMGTQEPIQNSSQTLSQIGAVSEEEKAVSVTSENASSSLQEQGLELEQWLTQGWNISERGNAYKNIQGHHVVIAKSKYGRFSPGIDDQPFKQWFSTEGEAKKEAFSLLKS